MYSVTSQIAMSVPMHILIRDTGHRALILKCIRFDIGLSQQISPQQSGLRCFYDFGMISKVGRVGAEYNSVLREISLV